MAATLSNGAKMPLVGLGTWQSKPGEVGAAVGASIEAGYRHIDAAACYGNEAEVGDALAAALVRGGRGRGVGSREESADLGEQAAGGLSRDDVFVTGKLWNSEHVRRAHHWRRPATPHPGTGARACAACA